MGIYNGDERIDSVNVGSKDMVVLMQDNHILALGKKYWAVDLGSLNWEIDGNIFSTSLVNIKPSVPNVANIYCSRYAKNSTAYVGSMPNKTISTHSSLANVYIRDDDFNNASVLKKSLNGVWLVYEFNTSKYDKVDLGSLSWQKVTAKRYKCENLQTIAKSSTTDGTLGNISALSLISDTSTNVYAHNKENSIAINSNSDLFVFKTENYYDNNDSNIFKASVVGKTLLYEKATPDVLLAMSEPEETE